MTEAASPQSLTPSEIVLLNGAQFAKKAMLGEKLLLADHKVSTTDLTYAMVSAAILANEKRGLVKLTLKKEKTMFGLSSKDSLKITRTKNGDSPWPAATTEAGILNAVGPDEKSVADVVIAFIGATEANPEQSYLARAKSVLADRGVLTREEKKLLGMKVSVAYHASDAQRAAIESQGTTVASSLLSGDVTHVRKEVQAGFVDRTQADSSYDT